MQAVMRDLGRGQIKVGGQERGLVQNAGIGPIIVVKKPDSVYPSNPTISIVGCQEKPTQAG